MAVHREPCHAGVRRVGSLEHSERAADQSFLLPLWPGLSESDQDHVVEQLLAALAEIGAVERRRA